MKLVLSLDGFEGFEGLKTLKTLKTLKLMKVMKVMKVLKLNLGLVITFCTIDHIKIHEFSVFRLFCTKIRMNQLLYLS